MIVTVVGSVDCKWRLMTVTTYYWGDCDCVVVEVKVEVLMDYHFYKKI